MNKRHVILAIETSGKSGSVAILVGQEEHMDCTMILLPTDAGSAKTLAPAMEQLLSDRKLAMRDLSAIALLSGPGSFTGLRVGVATAKAMAYALKIPTIEIDTLDAIAMQCPIACNSVHVILDAYRGQVFHAEFHIHTPDAIPRATRVSQTEILDIEVLLARVKAAGSPSEPIALCGPGCDRIRRYLQTPNDGQTPFGLELVNHIRWIDGQEMEPQAASVARLAQVKWLAGEVTDPFVLQPKYYRGSAAEEVAAKSKL